MPERFHPKKQLGQNFLFDENILKRIVSYLELSEKDTVLEIGAGLGALTDVLSRHAGKVIALEIDKEALGLLRGRFKDIRNIEILEQDFLQYNLAKEFARHKIKVVGNIPFYITSAIIERLLNFGDRIKSAFLTVQKEVAERITASAGMKEYGSLSCFVQYYARAKIVFRIKAGSFWPRPKVDAALIRLDILGSPLYPAKNEELLFKIIRNGFNQRRKMFVNALGSIIEKEKISAAIRSLGLDPRIRIEKIALKELAEISNYLS